MAREYLDVESMDDGRVTVRCPVVQWDAGAVAPYSRINRRRALVIRPDTGELVLVFRLPLPRGHAMISGYDPHEERHEREWPRLSRRLERHTNRSK